MKSYRRYTQKDVMKEAHWLYKLHKEHFPDEPCQFGECLRAAWEDIKYTEYFEARYEAEHDVVDWGACYEILPDAISR